MGIDSDNYDDQDGHSEDNYSEGKDTAGRKGISENEYLYNTRDRFLPVSNMYNYYLYHHFL